MISALSFRFNPAVAQAALETGAELLRLDRRCGDDTGRTGELPHWQLPGRSSCRNAVWPPASFRSWHTTWPKASTGWTACKCESGHLPQFPTGELKYNLTWSTDGLINEYCNPCEAIQEGKRFDLLPLEGLEHFSLDGVRYEAFNTSGGLGTLCETWEGKVRELNYKTVRYQGHRHLMHFLLNELRLSEDRETLKHILEHSVPITFQDVVVTFCVVSGLRRGDLVQLSDARKIYAGNVDGQHWSAIQITTAAAICCCHRSVLCRATTSARVCAPGASRPGPVSGESFRSILSKPDLDSIQSKLDPR